MLRQDLDHATGVLTITMNRPPVNALDGILYDRIHACLSLAEQNHGVKAVVIGSEIAKAFSAGADIKAFAHLSSADAEQKQLELVLRCLQDWVEFSKPTVAAVSAPAIGAGLMLACACDEIVMAERTWVSLPEIQLGLPTPIGAAIVGRRCSHAAVQALVQRGQRFMAQRCLEVGLADVLAADDKVMGVAQEHATVMAGFGSDVYAKNKRWINRDLSESLRMAALSVSVD